MSHREPIPKLSNHSRASGNYNPQQAASELLLALLDEFDGALKRLNAEMPKKDSTRIPSARLLRRFEEAKNQAEADIREVLNKMRPHIVALALDARGAREALTFFDQLAANFFLNAAVIRALVEKLIACAEISKSQILDTVAELPPSGAASAATTGHDNKPSDEPKQAEPEGHRTETIGGQISKPRDECRLTIDWPGESTVNKRTASVSNDIARHKARDVQKPVRRNQRYKVIDKALQEIADSRPRTQEEVFQSLERRHVVIPPAEPFMAACRWIAGFRLDAAAARAWLSKRWAELELSPLPRGPKNPKAWTRRPPAPGSAGVAGVKPVRIYP